MPEFHAVQCYECSTFQVQSREREERERLARRRLLHISAQAVQRNCHAGTGAASEEGQQVHLQIMRSKAVGAPGAILCTLSSLSHKLRCASADNLTVCLFVGLCCFYEG